MHWYGYEDLSFLHPWEPPSIIQGAGCRMSREVENGEVQRSVDIFVDKRENKPWFCGLEKVCGQRTTRLVIE